MCAISEHIGGTTGAIIINKHASEGNNVRLFLFNVRGLGCGSARTQLANGPMTHETRRPHRRIPVGPE